MKFDQVSRPGKREAGTRAVARTAGGGTGGNRPRQLSVPPYSAAGRLPHPSQQGPGGASYDAVSLPSSMSLVGSEPVSTDVGAPRHATTSVPGDDLFECPTRGHFRRSS